MLKLSKWSNFIFILLGLFLISFRSDSDSPTDEANLVLPKGFKAETVIESIGTPRHIAVNSNGDVYIKLERLKDGKGIMEVQVLRLKTDTYMLLPTVKYFVINL